MEVMISHSDEQSAQAKHLKQLRTIRATHTARGGQTLSNILCKTEQESVESHSKTYFIIIYLAICVKILKH